LIQKTEMPPQQRTGAAERTVDGTDPSVPLVRAVARVLVRSTSAGPWEAPAVYGSALAGCPVVVDVGDDPALLDAINGSVIRQLAFAAAGASGIQVQGRAEVVAHVAAGLSWELQEVRG
jgi:hypothetical protein